MKRRPSSLYILFAVFTLLLAACAPAAKPETPAQPPEAAPLEEESAPQAPPTEAPTVPPPAENAIYDITFNAAWSAETHSGYYVDSAHFSPFIAYAHNGAPEALIFVDGGISTPGVEDMAETGATGLLEGEITAIISAGSALSFVKGNRIDSPDTDSGQLQVSQAFSQLSFVSMIAPSPDWFVSASVDLFAGDQWVDELLLELVSYDAGTDSGTALTSPDADTNPREAITILPGVWQQMGTLTLTRISP